MESGYANPYSVAGAQPADRATFIRRTYTHLGLAIAAFAALLAFFLSPSQQGWVIPLVNMMAGKGWLIVLGAFMVVSWIAEKFARSEASRGMQYMGLGLFIVAQAIIFLPIMLMAQLQVGAGDPVIAKAGITTGFIFLGITATAFVTKKDFSFLRGFLVVGGFVALGIIVCGIIFGFSLGTFFAGAMAIFASVSILYNTSNIIHHYRTDQYVSASLGLFASVALLFWYILQIFMSRD